jgi:uncharacterized metal-binding protein YceD (DUF177 family)
MSGNAPEFSRVFAVEVDMGAGDEARTFAIEANEPERAALARRFGLLALDSLTATGRIEVFRRGRRARLTATLKAEATQSCVVSLAPVPARVEDTFSVTYDREAKPDALELEFDVNAEDPPDPLPEKGIDVGEAVAEHLGLALEPYPRAPGVKVELPSDPTEPRLSAFSVLNRLKDR